MKDLLHWPFVHAVRVSVVALALLVPTIAAAQSVTGNVGSNLGTYSVGEVSFGLTASSGTGGPYTWTLRSGALPQGVSIRTDLPSWMGGFQAALWGIATTPGTYAFTLRASNGPNFADFPTEMRITAFSVVNQQLPDAYVGTSYTYQFATSGGVGPVAFTDTSAPALPAGMTLSSAGLLTIAGTPAGNYNIQFSVTNGTDTLWRGASVRVSALKFDSDLLPNATQSTTYAGAVTVTGGTAPYTFSFNGGLPFGLTMNPAGAISGFVNSGPGKFSFNVTVTDSSVPPNSYTRNLAIVVVGSPKRLPSIQPYGGEFTDCTVGVPCTLGVHVNSGGVSPFTWSASGLPPGLSIGGSSGSWVQPEDGQISGLPTTPGDYTVAITVTDGDGASATNFFPLRVSVMALRQDFMPLTLGTFFSMPLRLIGGSPFGAAPSYTVSLAGGRLPEGVTFDATTLTISGTPIESGGFNPVFEVVDSTGARLRAQAGFNIGSNVPNILHNGDLGSWTPGSTFSQQLNACCASPYAWSIAGGAMPPGMTLSTAGLLSGALSTPGLYSFVVRVQDASSQVSARLFTIRVTPLTSSLSNNLPFGNVGGPYDVDLILNSATNPVTWTLEPPGYLPPGLALTVDAGAWSLSGTPTHTGQFFFSLRATDATGAVLRRGFNISIYPAGAFPPVGLGDGSDLGTWSIGEVHRGLTPSGGNGTYVWSLVSGALPPGVALRVPPFLPPWFNSNQKAGLIGIATTPGAYNFRLRVASGSGTDERDFTMRITNFAVDNQFNQPDAFVGQAYSTQLVASGNTGAVSWAANGPLPPGVSLSSAGVLSSTGSGLVAGFYGVNVAVSDTVETIFRTVSLSVFGVRITTSGDLPSGAQGTAYSATIEATFNGAACPTCTFTANGLPGNVSVSAEGVLTIPATAGPGRYGFDVSAIAPGNISYSKRMAVVIVPSPMTLPSISTFGNGLDDCTFAVPCSRTVFLGNGGAPPYTWTASGLPQGLAIRWGSGNTSRFVTPGDGEIVGLPREIGTFPVTVTVEDGGGRTATQTFPLRISRLLARDLFNAGDINVPYSSRVRILGGEPGYTTAAPFVSGRLPSGLSLNSATQAVIGTPQETGGFSFTLDVTDSASPGNTLRTTQFLQIGSSSTTININTTDLGTALIGAPFSRTLFACCVPGTFTWSLESGTLPDGLTLDAATGQITSGIGVISALNAPGVYTFRFKATHSTNSANFGIREVTLRLTKLSITAPASLPDGNVGAAYPSQTFVGTGGTGALTWTLAPFQLLPPGLSLSAAGILTGTPTASGQYSFSVLVSDEAGSVTSRPFNVSIYPAGQRRPLGMSFLGPFSGERGTFTRSIGTFQVSGGLPPYVFSLTPDAELPAGVAQIAGMRVLSGPPFPTNFSPATTAAVYGGVITASGVYRPSIRVTDANGDRFDRVFTVTITPLAILSQGQLPFATKDVPYAFQFMVTGGSGNYIWSAPTVPAGLTLDPTTGLLTGTPTSPGLSGISLTVTDPALGATTSGFFTLPINAYAFTASGALPTAQNGVPYSVTLSAPCGSGCTWSFAGGQIPRGLSLDASTGVLSGTPNGQFSGTFRVTVSGPAGSSTRQFSIVILSSTFPVLSIINTSVGDHTIGVPVGVALNAQGGAPPYTWTLDSGGLPPGVSLVSSAENYSNNFGTGMSYFVGKGLSVGTSSFTLRVTDSTGQFATRAFSWKISPLSWQYVNLPVSNGAALTYNQPYSQPLLILGGSNLYTSWSHTGLMPPGLALDGSTGVVSGTPTNTGGFTVPMAVTDSGGSQTSASVNITIGTGLAVGPIVFGAPNLGVVQLGGTVSFNVGASGPGDITYTPLSSLPAGFMLTSGADPVVGGSGGVTQLSGAATTPGTYTFTLRADSTTGAFAVRTFTFTVASLVVPGNLGALSDTHVGAAYSQQLVAFGAGAPGTWSLSTGSQLPAGLSLSSTGLLTGIPTQPGVFSFAVTVVDLSGAASGRTFTLNVSAVALSDDGVLPVATTAVPYSHTFSGGGGGVFWTATGLPAGFSLSSYTGALTGTPTTRGTFPFTVTATDGVRPISRRFTLYVRSPIQPVLTIAAQSTDLGYVSVGSNPTFTLNVSNGAPPYTWSVAPGHSLPPGMTLAGASLLPNLNPGAVALTGSPSAAGTYVFDLVVTDSTGAAARRTYTLRVSSLNILGGAPPAAVAGMPYSVRFAAPAATNPVFSVAPSAIGIADPLPPGITLASNGTLAGTTTSTGRYPFFVVVQDGATTFRRLVNLQVANGAGLRSTNGPVFHRAVGGGFAFRLTTTAPPATNFTWSIVSGTPPPGVVLATGLSPTSFPNSTWLAGRGTVAGQYTFTVRASENGNPANTADHQFTFTISPMQFVAPAWERINTSEVPAGRVGELYSFAFRIAGGTGPYTFAESPFDPLPAGLTLSATGVLSGVPAAGAIGTYAITPIVTDDSTGATAFAEGVSLVIAPAGSPAPLLRLFFVPGASVGVPYGFPLNSLLRGGTGPFSWTLAPGSSLPPGLALVNGAYGVSSYLAGTPTVSSATPFPFILNVTDSGSPAQVTSLDLAIRVSAVALSPDALPNGTVGTAYSVSLTPSGGAAPYTVQLFSNSGMPPGVTFSSGGLLSGTPASAGNYTLQMSVTDAAGNTLNKVYVITIDNAAGQAPAVSLSPKPITLYYEVGAPVPASIPVTVTTTSGALPFGIFVGNVPGASLSTNTGTTSTSVSLTLNPSSVPVGTYTGLIATQASGAVNAGDWTPVTFTVAPAPPCTYSVNPQSGSAEPAGGSGSFNVSAGYTCAWTAASSASWIDITGGASGTAQGTVSYSVEPNLGPNTPSRTGTISVNGALYTLTQFGTDALNCSFVINPSSVSATASGGTANVAVTASNALCSWTAASATMSVSPAGGTGNGSVTVIVPPNPDPVSRTLTATIGGQTFAANQTGIQCTVALSPYSVSAPAAGVTGSVDVTTPAGCGYSTVLGPSWISVPSGGSGTGAGTLVYAVEANSTTVPRSGTLTIGGQAFTVTQSPLACSVTVNTSSLGSPYGSGAASGTIGVTSNGTNCGWSASSAVPWATLSPTSGTGTVTISVFISSNAASTVERSGSLTVAGQTISVTQAGIACSYTLETPSGAAPAGGGSGSVRVLAPSACGWSATSNDGWLSVLSSGTGGTSEVQFAAAASPSATPRSGTLTIAGLTYSVNQAGAPCSYTIDGPSTSPTLANGAVSGQSFSFSAGFPGCTPAPVSYASWITVDSTSFAGLSGTVTYSVAANPNGATRTGTIIVGNAVFTVVQAGSPCAFSLNAYGRIFQVAGGDETVLGTPTAVGCAPDVGTDQPSFILLQPLTGPVLDIFSLPYAVAPFPVSLTTGVRFGRITFGGQIVLIKQYSW